MRNKELGRGQYMPRVYDFFPKTARGHGAQACFKKERNADGNIIRGKRRSALCNAVSCNLRTGKGEHHENQAQNRKDWEESVGIRRTSRTTRGASQGMKTASAAALDPKDFASIKPAGEA